MKYNEPFTMNDEQLERFKSGKKVFSEGKCAKINEEASLRFNLSYHPDNFDHLSDIEYDALIRECT